MLSFCEGSECLRRTDFSDLNWESLPSTIVVDNDEAFFQDDREGFLLILMVHHFLGSNLYLYSIADVAPGFSRAGANASHWLELNQFSGG